jgi:uncharacterized membrane protein YbhN (UPF0104 family)
MKKWLGVGLSLILLASLLLFVGPQIEWATVLHRLAATQPWAVIVAVVLFWANFAVSTERYRLILRDMPAHEPRFGPLYGLTFLSLFLAHLAAIGPAADVVRIGYGRLRMDVPMVTMVESVVYDRVLALVGLIVIGLMLLPLQIVRGIPEALWVPQLMLWLVGLVGIMLVTWGVHTPVMQRISYLAGVARSVKGFTPIALGRARLLRQAALALAYSGTYGLVIWVLARGMGLHLSLLDILQFSPLILLVQSMPIFYMGWGARETVLVGTLGIAGILSNEQAWVVSVATGAVFFLASIPGAVIWMFLPAKASGNTGSVK